MPSTTKTTPNGAEPGTVGGTAWVLSLAMLAFMSAVATSSSADNEKAVYTFAFDGKTATVAVDRRRYRMANVMVPWHGFDVPIVAHIAGAGSHYTIYARPAYGLFYEPGRHVYVTMSAKYLASEDASPSERLERGVPITPDVRRSTGTAFVDLFLDKTHPLVFSIAVRPDGSATVRLARQSLRWARAPHHV